MCNIDKCSIYDTQKIIKSKWIPIIIYVLDEQSLRFSDIKNEIAYISNEQLSRALKKLLRKNFIDISDNIYFLTKRGKKLATIVKLMQDL